MLPVPCLGSYQWLQVKDHTQRGPQDPNLFCHYVPLLLRCSLLCEHWDGKSSCGKSEVDFVSVIYSLGTPWTVRINQFPVPASYYSSATSIRLSPLRALGLLHLAQAWRTESSQYILEEIKGPLQAGLSGADFRLWAWFTIGETAA